LLLCLGETIGNWNAKVGSKEAPGVTSKFGLGIGNEAGQKVFSYCESCILLAAKLPDRHTGSLFSSSQQQFWSSLWVF